jgi:hypothetical protein
MRIGIEIARHYYKQEDISASRTSEEAESGHQEPALTRKPTGNAAPARPVNFFLCGSCQEPL